MAALPHNETRTIAAWAEAITARLADGDEGDARVLFIRIADHLASVPPHTRVELCAEAPASTGHDGYDAALASTVEYLLGQADLRAPAWASATPAATAPLHLASNPAIRADVEAETPDVFRRRNVFVPPDYFQSA